jgi:hypothetical protein
VEVSLLRQPGITKVVWSGAPVNDNDTGGATVCTQEVKLCPDGSAVGRIGPNCEFAKCSQTGGSSILPYDSGVEGIVTLVNSY